MEETNYTRKLPAETATPSSTIEEFALPPREGNGTKGSTETNTPGTLEDDAQQVEVVQLEHAMTARASRPLEKRDESTKGASYWSRLKPMSLDGIKKKEHSPYEDVANHRIPSLSRHLLRRILVRRLHCLACAS